MRKVKLTTEQEFELCRVKTVKTVLPYVERDELENQFMVIYERYLYLQKRIKKHNLA
jgi:hypothetical protein